MYRLQILVIFCVACHSTGTDSKKPGPDSLAFLKNSINPLLQDLETTAAKKKLDSLLPAIKKRDNYIEMCSWLRCMAVKNCQPGNSSCAVMHYCLLCLVNIFLKEL